MKSNVPVKQPDPLSRDLGTNDIKVPLGNALGSLSINLEEELNRYRRQRQGHAPSAPRGLRMKVRQKPVDLISIPAKRVPTPPPAPPQAKISGAVTIPPPPPPNPFLAKQVYREQASVPPQTATVRAESLPQTESALARAHQNQPGDRQTNPESPDLTAQALVPPHAFAPEDYLASSEELISSLPEPEPTEPLQHRPRVTAKSLVVWPDGLSSPLGIAALMVVLVGSASLGYVFTNPAILGQIPLVNRFTANSETATAPNQSPEGNAELFDNDPLQGAGPDLSEREFRELTLESLSTLEVDRSVSALVPASTPTTASTPATASTPTTSSTPETTPPTETSGSTAPVASAPSANQPQARPAQPSQLPTPRASQPTTRQPAASQPAAQPQPQPQQAPAPAATQSTPASPPPASSAPVSPAPAPSNPPAANSSSGQAYDVVTDFTGDQSLQDARNAVGDAYLRNYSDGARIQLGTYDTPEAAQQRVQELHEQGIPARIHGE